MKTFFRVFSLLGLVLASVIFVFVFLGEKEIPDRIEILENEELNVGDMYSSKFLQKDIPVFSVNSPKCSNSSRDSKSYSVDVSLLGTIPVKSTSVIVNKRQYVVPSGEIFGVKIHADGVMVVGMDAVATENGSISPAKEAGVKIGDIIHAVNGKEVHSADALNKAFKNGSDTAKLTILRNGKQNEITLNLVYSKENKEKKAGLWVRDSTAGVGTLTFYEPETGVFGGLGHAICDSDTGTIMPLRSGKAIETKVSGCYKGGPGITGELCGVFQKRTIGELYANLPNGVYGKLKKCNSKQDVLPVATKKEVKLGKAQIISTVDETGPHYYDVEITKIYPNSDENGKNMILEIKDDALIAKTGGIVQGMSGSPILQNGMLVGAVTHVFVNNARQGYGVFAENMLRQAKSFEAEALEKAA